MKRLVIALGLFVLACALAISEQWLLFDHVHTMCISAETIQDCVEDNHFTNAAALTDTLQTDWEQLYNFSCLFRDHTALRDVGKALGQIQLACRMQERYAACEGCELLIRSLEILQTSEACTWQNIF